MTWWVRQKIHSSWRIALASLLFVVGVAVAPTFYLDFWVGVAALVLVFGLMFLPYIWALPCIALASLCAGLGYGVLHATSRSIYASYLNQQVVVSGRVKEDVSRSASGSFSIQLDRVIFNDVSMPGTVLVTSRQSGGALRGDIVTFRGTAQEGFGSFPASVRLDRLTSVERVALSDVGRVMRDGFADKVRLVIPDPQASLGIGFLTGQKSALPSDLSDALKVAGLTHIVVASGYNLTILVRLARKLLARFSKYLSALSAGLMIVSFVMVTGLSPSMTRAGLVSSMSLLGWYYGHVFHPFVLLPVAAVITVILQPSYVWGDLGWQLSFTAFIGVMIVAPLLQSYFFGLKQPSILRQILGETIAAHAVTVPIIALSFGTVSHVAILANLLVVPLVPLAMLLTFLCGMGSLLAFPLVDWIAAPTTWLLGYMTSVATFVAELPWAQSTLELPGLMWLGYGLMLVIACFWMWRKTKYNFRSGEPLAY